ncbi:hypothetical protein GCM10011512_13640 [Tersicoccus solisilvae]|uniref:Uroporphyrinogen-III synthase n=1 Tax=Tersicoccus solisilvae TaxID=1882339 RepID=A0ABQ1NZM4_9MICC|nr:hypothetical protein GCM10011512_13640 [Tersicoccus solisilvae]
MLAVPVIDFAWPVDLGPLDAALAELRTGRYGWLAVTSATTVTALTRRADALGTGLPALLAGPSPSRDSRTRVRVAAVAAATAAALERAGVAVDLVPHPASGADLLVAAWPETGPGAGNRTVLLPHSDLAAGTLETGLAARGWTVHPVTAYRTVDHPAAPEQALEPEADVAGLTVVAAQAARPDAAVVTSPSTVRRWLAVGHPCPLVAIGPTSAAAATDAGHPAAATAASPDPADVLAAVAAAVRGHAAGSPTARSAHPSPSPSTPERRWDP